jgi:hypothetical protein
MEKHLANDSPANMLFSHNGVCFAMQNGGNHE